MQESTGGLRLTQEAPAGLVGLLLGSPGREDDGLDRDLAFDLRIIGQEDLAHRALADFAQYFEAAQPGRIHRPLAPSGDQWARK